MCIKPLNLAAMLHCACCLQYIPGKKLTVVHKGDFKETIHGNNVIISPSLIISIFCLNPSLPYLFLGGMSQEPDIFFIWPY